MVMVVVVAVLLVVVTNLVGNYCGQHAIAGYPPNYIFCFRPS